MNGRTQCEGRREAIAALVMGELEATKAGELRKHIETCGTCRGFREALAGKEEMIRAGFDAISRSVDPLARTLLEWFGKHEHKGATRVRTRPRRLIGGLRNMRPLCKVLSAILLVAFVLMVTAWFGVGAEIALADVQQKLAGVLVVAFRMEAVNPGLDPLDAQAYVTQDSKLRFETANYINVIDWEGGRMLSMDLRESRAVVGNVENLESNPYHRDWLKELQRIIGNKDALRLEKHTINGVAVVGWQTTDDDWTVTVWADAKSADLVQVEFVRGAARMVFSDFRYDVDVDESLMDMEPPADYAVYSFRVDASQAGEPDVICMLRIWAMGNGGVFPDSLDPWKFNAAAERVNWREVENPEQASQAISQAFWWINANPGWVYAGQGVKSGEADTPIFWWRPTGSATYRVIYADLSARDVAAADLPATDE